jgi:dienelactone hydrolase
MPVRPPSLARLAAMVMVLALPAGAAPFPRPEAVGLLAHGIAATLLVPEEPRGTIILVHDPDGPAPRATPYEDQLLAAGFAVLTILAADVEAETVPRALLALTSGAHGPAGPIGLLGFGRGARLALAPAEGIGARALLYPGCRGLPHVPDDAPLLLLHGSEDAANARPDCEEAAAELARGKRDVRHIVYRGAGYAWDRTHLGSEAGFLLPRPDRAGAIAARPWPELGAMSAAEVAGFFSRALARRD